MAANKRFFLTIAAIIKDEGPYLAEWLEYHFLRGVEHVYLYDNRSSDGPAELLADYLIQGRVTLIQWPEYPGQHSAYSHALRIFGRDSDWMAVIDIDEFIQPVDDRSIASALAAFGDDVDQILLPWVHFGSSGHDERPEGLVIENYVHRSAEVHLQTKTIVRPEAVTFIGVHHAETRHHRTVDSAGHPALERWIQPRPLSTDLRINHYFTKSREEFTAKIMRGQSDGGRGKSIADFDRFATPVLDDSLSLWGPRVRAAIAETAARPRRHMVHAAWSAQSELVPSDDWQKAMGRIGKISRENLPGDAQGRLSIGHSHAILSGTACPPADAMRALIDLENAIGAWRVAGMETGRFPGSGGVAGDGRLGRPFLFWQGRAEADARLDIRLRGRDAGGKAWNQEASLDIDPSGTLAFLILSQRTMRIDRIDWSIEGASVVCEAAGIYSFI